MKIKQPTLLNIDGVGEVLFKPDIRCKRLSIRLKLMQGVSVTFPPGYDMHSAINFIIEKQQWINEAKKKIEEKESEITVFDENTLFKSRSFSLKVQRAQRNDVRLHLHNGILNVYYPAQLNVTEPTIQEAIRYGIEEALRMEARRYLPARLTLLAQKHGFKYKRLFIKNLSSRWGSCSYENNINLNLQLMRLPDHLIDYVLLHELCHTIEKNHGSGFWALMNKVTGNKAKLLTQEMKQFRTTIY
jgi:predicted metal-dependent hydrolase